MNQQILERLFTQQKHSLDYFFETMNLAELEAFLEVLGACKGMIVLTGVGKSGLVAKKMAVTLTSTGSKALFLSPTNALHGDIGILNPNDIFIVFSKSGESDELLNLIPFVRNQGVKILSIVCEKENRLSLASDHSLFVPMERELCPFDLAPTTSTTIQSIVGDILAIALMEKKNFSMQQFAKSHPAGRLGKRILIKVKDIMLNDGAIPLCRPKDLLVDTLVELSDKQCGCILVTDTEGKLEGIFTDGDLRRALQKKGGEVLQQEMHSLMIKNPRVTNADALAWDAMKQMESNQKHPVMVLPVVDESNLVVGIIKMHDLIQSGL